MNPCRCTWLLRSALALLPALLSPGLALPDAAATAATPITGPIIAPRTLTLAESPYYVDSDLLILGPLEIEPGVEIIFGPGASLEISAGGSLLKTVVGGDPVVFRGSTRRPGYWDGIVAQPSSVALWLDTCDISDAKTAVTTAARVRWIKNCALHGNEAGLAVTPAARDNTSLANLVLENNTGYALRFFLPPDVSGPALYVAAPIPGLVVDNNGVNAVQVDRSITGFAWQVPSSPAYLTLAPLQDAGGAVLPFDLPGHVPTDHTLGDKQTLRILPGAIVRSPSLTAGGGASLLAEGTLSQPIRFVAPPSALAGWKGVKLETGSSATLKYCDISGVQDRPGLTVAADAAVVTRCALHDNSGYGLYLEGAGIRPLLDALTITNNGGDAIAQRTADMQPSFSGLTVSGNGRDALLLLDGFIAGEVALASPVTGGGPLPLIGGLSVGDGGSLRILPGTELYMGPSDRLTVQAGGVLTATGALITGLDAQPGSWEGVVLEAGSTVLIEDSTLAYGGAPAPALSGVVSIFSSDVTLRNCRIHHGVSHGVQLYGHGLTSVLEALTIEDNAGAAVSEANGQDATMNPVYRGLQAKRNGQNGIVLDVRGFYHDNHLELPGTTSGGAVLPYLVPELLTVAASTTLTIDNGVVMQFTDPRNWGYLAVSGRLAASGVTFTGRSDTPGSWAGLRIQSGGSAQLFACQILYAGDRTNNTSWQGVALRTETAEPVTLHYCTIRDSDGLAVSVMGPATVDLRWSNIHDNALGGVSGPSYVPPAAASDLTAQTEAPGKQTEVLGDTPFVRHTVSASPVDARYSWWGHASGPVHNPDNLDGQGDRVTGEVLFTPWAAAPVLAPDYSHRIFLPRFYRAP